MKRINLRQVLSYGSEICLKRFKEKGGERGSVSLAWMIQCLSAVISWEQLASEAAAYGRDGAARASLSHLSQLLFFSLLHQQSQGGILTRERIKRHIKATSIVQSYKMINGAAASAGNPHRALICVSGGS